MGGTHRGPRTGTGEGRPVAAGFGWALKRSPICSVSKCWLISPMSIFLPASFPQPGERHQRRGTLQEAQGLAQDQAARPGQERAELCQGGEALSSPGKRLLFPGWPTGSEHGSQGPALPQPVSTSRASPWC